jgi:malate synthase
VRGPWERTANDHAGCADATTSAMSTLLQLLVEHKHTIGMTCTLRRIYSAKGPRTEKGLRTNISVGLTYLEAWLGGSGCIPIHNMMEDAATAEIARTQVGRGSRVGVQELRA